VSVIGLVAVDSAHEKKKRIKESSSTPFQAVEAYM
jgi:hypothetical protein